MTDKQSVKVYTHITKDGHSEMTEHFLGKYVLLSDYDLLLQELKDYREAVEFYANKENWTLIREGDFFYSCPADEDEEYFNPKDEDDDRVIGGKLARSVLNKYKAKSGGEV